MGEGRRVVFSADRAPDAIGEMDAAAALALQARPGLRHRARPTATCGWASWSASWTALAASRSCKPMAARPEVLQFLADRFTDSVRELEGALNTLVARTGDGLSPS